MMRYPDLPRPEPSERRPRVSLPELAMLVDRDVGPCRRDMHRAFSYLRHTRRGRRLLRLAQAYLDFDPEPATTAYSVKIIADWLERAAPDDIATVAHLDVLPGIIVAFIEALVDRWAPPASEPEPWRYAFTRQPVG